MKRRAVGFYWTLPVPWAGFSKLPADIEAAAASSRTIAFQRALIHDFAGRNGLTLVHEAAFLEIDPDRGSSHIHGALDKAAAKCREQAAILLFVDFSAVQGWRSHEPMLQWLRAAEVESLPVEAEPVRLSGEPFDPHQHFAEWRERQRNWTEGKEARGEAALHRIRGLKAEGASYSAIAGTLNREGLRSLSGKPWSGDGVRKFVLSRGG